MEEKRISDKKEVENVSMEISPEKEQRILLPSYTKSYSQTRIESTAFEYTWEIDRFIILSNSIDTLYSPLFPETAEYKIQMNVLRKTDSNQSCETTQFYLLTTEAFTGLCTTIIKFSGESYFSSNSISFRSSNRILLIEIEGRFYKQYSSTSRLKIQCKFEIFSKVTSNTIHMNLQPSSTVFSKDIRSHEDSTLDESNKELEDEKSINFVVENDKYVISKKLLHATNSSYFKNICLTHEGKEKNVTNEITSDMLPAFLEMLHFIITGSIKLKDDYYRLKKLLAIADKYDVPTLKLTCEHYLLRIITVCNAMELIQLAFRHNAEFLKIHSAVFIKFHIKEIMDKDELKNIDISNKMDLIDKTNFKSKISTDLSYLSPVPARNLHHPVYILGLGESSWRFRSQFFNQKPQKFFTDGIMALPEKWRNIVDNNGRAMMPSVKNFCGFWLKNCDRKRHELSPGPNVLCQKF